MYSLIRTPHPATGVEHSIYCHLFSYRERNLVVAGANSLRAFRLVPELTEDSLRNVDNPPKMRLECLASWTLHAPIMSVQKVSLMGSQRDTLLLSFQDAKLSVVEYDPDTHDLKTLSLHIFEDEETRQGYIQNDYVPFVRVDPDNRCAAMLVYGRKIVVLPFRREGISQDTDEMGDKNAPQQKIPVMASYTLDLKAVIQSNTVDNIIDIQFLHGYNQPTMLILYEPLKTFPGRIAVRKDTCRMDVITLDVKERIAAFIWSREVLPFDCVKALPVPKPIGGTLVFAVNSLFYLNQGIPPYGVSLNAIGDKDASTDIHIRQLEGVKLTLDCAQAEFITPERAVISLQGGELYVLTLLIDGMRSVRGFHFDRAAASVLTTSLAICEDNYLFLGSRLGNSLVLQFTEKDIGSVFGPGGSKDREPPVKKQRMDGSTGDWMASNVSDIQDIDLEVYGQDDSANTAHKITSYTFEVCDSLLNIGPCGQVAMGEPSFLSEEFSPSTLPDPDIELVTTSGHGKNGALCVLQQTIRPQVVTTFELPGCLDMWTVVGDSDLPDGHAFLILSRQDSTMVLQTGQEINELDQSGFYTQGPTVFTGNMGNNRYIVQVSPQGVRLLNGSEQIQHLPLELGSPICQASVADPYLVVLTEDGQSRLLTLDATVGMPQLSAMKPYLPSRSRMTHVCAYKDVSGMFTAEMPASVEETTAVVAPSVGTATTSAMEDEDDLLYGDSSPSFTLPSSSTDSASKSGRSKPWKKHMKPIKPTFWAVCLRENGSLEFYILPKFDLRYVVTNFPLGASVLSDAMTTTATRSNDLPPENIPAVTEIMLVGLGGNNRRPMLLARTDDNELMIYEAYPYCEKHLEPDQLKLRFKKVRHGLILRERKGKSRRNREQEVKTRTRSIRYFADIAGYEGLFLCGPYPHWLMLTGRGELRTHPMLIDGSVPCLAPFHNVNCPQGFIYFNRKGELRICVLPTHLSYDAPWPVRKVPLRCTPHFVTFHLESKTYAVVTSAAEPTKTVWMFNGDDKELVEETRDERFPLPNTDKFAIQLFSPVSWEPIPGTKLNFDDWERCTMMKHLYLSAEGSHSGQRGYLVCCTSYCYGEDVTPRGYIRIYDVIEVVPEPGQPLTKNKIKTVYDKEQKGPITAVSAVNGFLVAAVGQKIYIYQYKDKDLYGMAFIDSQIYIHQLCAIKNFILVADVAKSVDLLMFQQDYRTLSVISRDTKPLDVYSCEYLVDNNNLGFIVTDGSKNVILYMYQPEARESNGGQKLLHKADFQLGQHVTCLFRVRTRITDPSANNRVITGWEKRQVTWFSTLDGGVGYILPCPEKTYRRLLMLQNVLSSSLPHTAGLNPKGCRTLRTRRRELSNPCRSIIDGDLTFRFTDLSVTEKTEVAKKIGTSIAEVLDDLSELDRMAAHF